MAQVRQEALERPAVRDDFAVACLVAWEITGGHAGVCGWYRDDRAPGARRERVPTERGGSQIVMKIKRCMHMGCWITIRL